MSHVSTTKDVSPPTLDSIFDWHRSNIPRSLQRARLYIENMWGVPLSLGDRMFLRKCIEVAADNLPSQSLMGLASLDIETVSLYLMSMAGITDFADRDYIESCCPNHRVRSKINANLYCTD